MSSEVQLPQADFELDQVTVVVLVEGPRRNDYSEEESKRLLNAHLDYTVDLVRSDHLLHAGALIDTEAESGRLTGLAFSRRPAAELADAVGHDPAVVAGLEDLRILTHVFPKGSVSFKQAVADQAP